MKSPGLRGYRGVHITIPARVRVRDGRGQFPAASNCNLPPQGPEGVPWLLKIFTLLQQCPDRYYA